MVGLASLGPPYANSNEAIMLSTKTFYDIQQLLAEGRLSQRAIARQLGVHRNTVNAIARGTRPDYDALRLARQRRTIAPPVGPKRRCGRCGALVYLPCVACAVRDALSRTTPPGRAPEPCADDGALALALRPYHHARYEQVRARRLADEARCA